MAKQSSRFKYIVTAFLLSVVPGLPVAAQETSLDTLYQELFDATPETHSRIADQINARWERSGSPALDLLLRRGAEAMEENAPEIAVEHFTALVDHAPDFAEGYHGRASAYFALGLVGPAIDDLRQVLVLEPRHFEAMFGLGIMMEELGRPADALEVYRLIQEIYPLDPDAAQRIEMLALEEEGQAL